MMSMFLFPDRTFHKMVFSVHFKAWFVPVDRRWATRFVRETISSIVFVVPFHVGNQFYKSMHKQDPYLKHLNIFKNLFNVLQHFNSMNQSLCDVFHLKCAV